MDNLTERLLDPKTVDEALAELQLSSRHMAEAAAYSAILTLHRLLATAKSEGAAEAYDDIRAQAEDLRKEGGIRASLLRLLAEECVSSAAAIRKGIEAKEGK